MEKTWETNDQNEYYYQCKELDGIGQERSQRREITISSGNGNIQRRVKWVCSEISW